MKKTIQERGYLVGLDGRRLHVRSEHGALNLLIQSAAALMVAKKWLELVDDEIRAQGVPATILAIVHDELQISVSPRGDAEHVGANIACRMAEEAGRFFKIRCPIEAEYSVGTTWRDTH